MDKSEEIGVQNNDETLDNMDESIDEFISYIKINRPAWFKANEWIEKTILLSRYEEKFDKAPHNFYKVLKNRVYSNEKRGVKKVNQKDVRTYMIKLMSFDDINSPLISICVNDCLHDAKIDDDIKDQQLDITEQETKKLQYVYLLREREFLRLNEHTYKIGKTTQIPDSRLSGYPKGSEVYLFEEVSDCYHAEKIIIERFDKKFKRQSKYGREYYSGDIKKMKMVFRNICNELLYDDKND